MKIPCRSLSGWFAVLTVVLVVVCSSTAPATAAGPFAYIANSLDGTVSVIDTASNSVITTFPVGENPLGVAVNAAGTRVYVTNSGSDEISVIDTMTNAVVATIPLAA